MIRLNQESVIGALFADIHGLCISGMNFFSHSSCLCLLVLFFLNNFFVAKGNANSLASGFLTALLSRSEELGEDPTVCIETDGQYVNRTNINRFHCNFHHSYQFSFLF